MFGANAMEASRADGIRLRLDVWADVGCPWCYLGIHRLRRALDELGAAQTSDLQVRSFELDSAAPTEPVAITEIFARKHGVSPRDASRAEAAIERLAAAEGLPFSSDRLHGNSFDVHRVLQFANRQGRGVDFFETVQRRYFAADVNPFERDALIAVAAEVGLDGDAVREVLGGNAYADEVRRDEGAGRRLGVAGVPFVLLDERYAIPGAQSADAYAQAITQVTEER
jgi:predicted DsbA family dithiol-disulfide isomerase